MKLRVGILGCASIARRSLIPAFAAHPDFELVAIASRSPDKAADLATQYNCRGCSYGELIAAADIDFVYCPLPTGLHYEWVKKSLEAGKHVLCEKSLAQNLTEVEDLVSTARRCNRFLMESFQFRFHAQNVFVRDIIDSERLGKIRSFRASFGFPPFADAANIRYNKELGGGALLDAGAYTIKASTYFLGKELKVVAANSWSDEHCSVDLGGNIFLTRSDGVVSETSYGFDNFYQCGYEIWCQKGKISASRAYTARPDFEAEVKVEMESGSEIYRFQDDHFAKLLNYIYLSIKVGDYEKECCESLMQGRLLEETRFCHGKN